VRPPPSRGAASLADRGRGAVWPAQAFDVTRKLTYKNLSSWCAEPRELVSVPRSVLSIGVTARCCLLGSPRRCRFKELQEHRKNIPCIVVANKIDRAQQPKLIPGPAAAPHCGPWVFIGATLCPVLTLRAVSAQIAVDRKATTKSFNFATKRNLDFYYVSAADGTNVVKVRGACSMPACPSVVPRARLTCATVPYDVTLACLPRDTYCDAFRVPGVQ